MIARVLILIWLDIAVGLDVSKVWNHRPFKFTHFTACFRITAFSLPKATHLSLLYVGEFVRKPIHTAAKDD